MATASAQHDALPFVLPAAFEKQLRDSATFQILRQHLSATLNCTFCAAHGGSGSDRHTWLLYRDILHALIAPLAKLYLHAERHAEDVLQRRYIANNKGRRPLPDDLELAYSRDARSAFVWLGIFVNEELDWMETKAWSCPACITVYSFSTESTIRLLLTACLLSASPSQPDKPTLPNFTPLLPPLVSAISNDPYWGPPCAAHLRSRAESSVAGIKALISQANDLEAVLSTPPTPSQHPSAKRMDSGLGMDDEGRESELVPIRTAPLPKDVTVTGRVRGGFIRRKQDTLVYAGDGASWKIRVVRDGVGCRNRSNTK
ncbi:hypothetical protein P152DRAFT_461714 [Eremomyces bilateralis CBS 781.70]|uniref:Uncharacterized protein n=1 Tax=Eremomyces bilateralis CBS 781.70 TaxID=1392243 RepID=A0A6G1FUC1_9PEZI|nr:uncharacterized protein P152DRAFT_461714 [Eremomyces bilateralis CBS 781.70]KAF1809306.1 hypothetical protein P152DRAFT_461714 [Eremomyces bilateralis CBS 781.70]